MKTVWNLIFEWKFAREEAQRAEAASLKAHKEACNLDARFKAILRKHGPIQSGNDLYLLPDQPDEPIRRLSVKESTSITLETTTDTPA